MNTTQNSSQPIVNQAKSAGPEARWKIFIRLMGTQSAFYDVYLVCRGSAKSPRYSLVWHASENRWVRNKELDRARARAGDLVLSWSAERVRQAVNDLEFGRILS